VSEQPPPVGWYPDPTGRFEVRWFDGRWTDQVATRGQPGTDPMPTPVLTPTSKVGPSSTTRWLLIGGAAALVAVVAVIIGVSGGGSGDSTSDQADGTELSGNFCTDAQTNWIRVNRAWTTADTIVERGVPVQDWASDHELLVSTATMARQLAGEAPDVSHDGVNFKQDYTELAGYLDGVAALASKQGGTESERTNLGQQAPAVGSVQMDTELTVVTGLPGAVC